MSRIDHLIAELCPNGVELRPLGDVAGYSETRVDANDLDQHSFVGVDNLLPNKAGKVEATYPPNTASLTAYEPGDILLGNIRPYLKKVWLADRDGGCSGDVLAIRIARAFRTALDPYFMYFLLSSDDFFAFNMQHAKGAKMPRGSKAAILKYRIPLPPPVVQLEIVEILDRFTQLEAELEAELEARRRQYEYYRDALLTFDTTARRAPLGSLARFTNGKPHERLVDPEGNISLMTSRFISTQGQSPPRRVRAEAVLTPAHENDVALVMSDLPNGRALARAFYVDADHRYAANQRVCLLTVLDAEAFLPRFLYYVIDRNPQLLAYDSGVDQTHLKKDWILDIKLPVPPLSEQQRIVSTLDKFYALVNDLSIGLPAELNARRQQYEFYRDKLLTFKVAA